MNTRTVCTRFVLVLGTLVLGVFAATSSALAWVVGTGTSASCTEAALGACLPGGGSFDGTVTFACGGARDYYREQRAKSGRASWRHWGRSPRPSSHATAGDNHRGAVERESRASDRRRRTIATTARPRGRSRCAPPSRPRKLPARCHSLALLEVGADELSRGEVAALFDQPARSPAALSSVHNNGLGRIYRGSRCSIAIVPRAQGANSKEILS